MSDTTMGQRDLDDMPLPPFLVDDDLIGRDEPAIDQRPVRSAVPLGPVDLPRIEAAVREILLAIGEDPDRDGLQNTPSRVARMYAEVFAGLRESPADHLQVMFEADHDEMVMVRDIALTSMCEHHLVPFIGKAHVAYIPGDDGRVTGLSKLARLVDAYAKRPQVQERLTSQIADELERTLAPKGVLVVIEAEHLCMSMRGVRKPGASTVTSAVRGLFRDSTATRFEAMRLIDGR
ncbi:MAG: GTP cyclohydrolase I FolE [Acidimicrobiales bacterium]